jgi:hypothetical protein
VHVTLELGLTNNLDHEQGVGTSSSVCGCSKHACPLWPQEYERRLLAKDQEINSTKDKLAQVSRQMDTLRAQMSTLQVKATATAPPLKAHARCMTFMLKLYGYAPTGSASHAEVLPGAKHPPASHSGSCGLHTALPQPYTTA